MIRPEKTQIVKKGTLFVRVPFRAPVLHNAGKTERETEVYLDFTTAGFRNLHYDGIIEA